MYTKSRQLILASSIALALASVSGAAFAGTPCEKEASRQAGMSHQAGTDITEARQESQISTSYSLSPYLRANNLEVSVDGGTATLTGTVEEDVNKEMAEQIALGVTGIKTVDNQIVVSADYVPSTRSSQERSFGEVVDDATITATVKSKLLWSKNTEGLQMNVDTTNGKVTLSGDAESEDAKALAATMAENTRGVVSVDNRLVVNSTKPASEVANNDSGKAGFPDVSDGWITTKVTSTFMYSANVESHNIEVSTDQGIVTLTGKVDSDIERKEAIELAGNIRGVKSVNATGLTI
jgi:osmotically-inducible protein OsmY